MKVISTNLAKPVFFQWNGETHSTGIFKYPVDQALTLQEEIVEDDTIADRRVHGGIFKACYLFSSDAYPYWKEKYPNLDWDWGMFGENLTVEGLDESKLQIGNVYRLGTALVQITQPREPCYKLGFRFGNQDILGQFIEHAHPGTYVRVLETGQVKNGDKLELVEKSDSPLTVKQFYGLLFARKKDTELVKLAIDNEALPLRKREKLKKFLK
ncbi:MOSC domain-containing protein [Flagellimonas meridianipacifica]|uniref:MOSC domain-containing protein YiiM n=1 Tax=Flagellimonas meridianipacifica TaxID=1080225 RepID=A0A2T0M6P6_9FLAO|nr:MOSC domain-containing protein [Allomuricauda pacifica]PRX53170.1 MOSC domain-containing protein YiiM [Allomuricauda pacifica]